MLEKVSLTDLLGGAAVEAFDIEMDRVSENILDPNTEPTAVREIVLKVKIKPSQNRDKAAVMFECYPKLAKPTALTTMLYFGRQGGKAVAVEQNPAQPSMFDVEGEGKLKSIAGGKA